MLRSTTLSCIEIPANARRTTVALAQDIDLSWYSTNSLSKAVTNLSTFGHQVMINSRAVYEIAARGATGNDRS